MQLSYGVYLFMFVLPACFEELFEFHGQCRRHVFEKANLHTYLLCRRRLSRSAPSA